MEDVYLVIAGLVGGFLAGLLGVGGGIIFIVVLPIALAAAGICDADIVAMTVANSIFGTFIASLSANIRSIIKGKFQYKEVLIMGVFAGLSSIMVMKFIVTQAWYDRVYFNIVVCILLSFMLVRLLLTKGYDEAKEKQPKVSTLIIIGLSAGLIAALSGLGGGIIIVPLLLNLCKMSIKKVKVLSLGVIGVIAIILTSYNMLVADTSCIPADAVSGRVGLLVFPITLVMGAGVVVGTPLGMRVSRMLSQRLITYAFSALLVIVILKKIHEIATALAWI